jgi:hypothetical protein
MHLCCSSLPCGARTHLPHVPESESFVARSPGIAKIVPASSEPLWSPKLGTRRAEGAGNDCRLACNGSRRPVAMDGCEHDPEVRIEWFISIEGHRTSNRPKLVNNKEGYPDDW